MTMSGPKPAVGLALAMGLGTGGAAQATLSDLGDGTVFDDVLKVMWLKNANLAASETFGVAGAGGYMDWLTAKEWIAAMNAANYLGYRDWRLRERAAAGESRRSGRGPFLCVCPTPRFGVPPWGVGVG